MPWAWWVSQVCELFPGRFPSECLAEWARSPVGLLEDIAEMRAFAAVWRQAEHARTAAEMPQGPLADLLREIEFGLAAEELSQR
jgi:hypothetical protein